MITPTFLPEAECMNCKFSPAEVMMPMWLTMPLALSEPVNRIISPGFAFLIPTSVPSSVKLTDDRGAFTLK